MAGTFYEGEDVPLRVEYTDPDTGDPVDPDDTDSSGNGNAQITIIAPDGTELVSAVEMSWIETGVLEHVWDTSTNATGTGEYEVEMSAVFSGETKITKTYPELR